MKYPAVSFVNDSLKNTQIKQMRQTLSSNVMMMTDGSDLNAYFRLDIEVQIKEVKSNFN